MQEEEKKTARSSFDKEDLDYYIGELSSKFDDLERAANKILLEKKISDAFFKKKINSLKRDYRFVSNVSKELYTRLYHLTQRLKKYVEKYGEEFE